MKKFLKFLYINLFINNFFVKKRLKGEILQKLLTNSERMGITISKKGYLKEIGWWNAWSSKSPVNQNNESIPWVTYSFISFIKERLTKEMTMLEYGSGNSTHFYSKKVKNVIAIENDLDWYNKLSSVLPPNTKVIYKSTEEDQGSQYSSAVLEQDQKFDIIIIDGRFRVNCIKYSIEKLNPCGVMVLDDSERPKYEPGIKELINKGFKQLDFWGIAPGINYNKCTSLFYKKNNCLNI